MHKSTDTSADWDLYRYFLAVMECGSLSAAARRLLARVDNLADKDYQLARTYATPGRTLFVGLKWAPQ